MTLQDHSEAARICHFNGLPITADYIRAVEVGLSNRAAPVHRIYLASSWKNQREVLALADHLEIEGHEVDAFCRTNDKRFAFHWSELVDDEIELMEYDAISFLAEPQVVKAFDQDKWWLDWSDTVVLMLPCGRSAHLEAGYGVGQGKRVFIYGEFLPGEFDVMYRFASGLFRINELPELCAAIRGA